MNKTGYTKQGVRDLNYIKGKSTGIRLDPPPGMVCQHPDAAIEHDHNSGCTHCRRCGSYWDFDGKPY